MHSTGYGHSQPNSQFGVWGALAAREIERVSRAERLRWRARGAGAHDVAPGQPEARAAAAGAGGGACVERGHGARAADGRH